MVRIYPAPICPEILRGKISPVSHMCSFCVLYSPLIVAFAVPPHFWEYFDPYKCVKLHAMREIAQKSSISDREI